VIPSRYSASISRGTPTEVQLVVDGSDPQTVASATNTAAAVIQARSSEVS
jgi:hypothetical protein